MAPTRWMSGEPRHIAAIALEKRTGTQDARPWQAVKEELGL